MNEPQTAAEKGLVDLCIPILRSQGPLDCMALAFLIPAKVKVQSSEVFRAASKDDRCRVVRGLGLSVIHLLPELGLAQGQGRVDSLHRPIDRATTNFRTRK